MYKSQNYIEKPINLLSFDSFGHAILNQQAIDIVQSIPKPISILSVAGPYRTGKSFLLNSLISAKEQFQVSSTTRSCTKGLWIWGNPLTSVDEQGKITNVLVIDTEGFGSCEETHDKRIIILALLLSTSFIYNSKGLIDGDSLTDLRYVIEETKKVKKELSFDSVTDFHWILRDFHYQMVNELNLPISPNQYMEKSLKEYSDNFPHNKEVYKILCQFFRNRTCHTLITPETDPSLDQNPQFVEQLIKLKKILTGIPSLDLNGQTLAEIVEAYVSAMNQNYTETGVYREGAECRLRINCLSQLCKELQTINHQDQPEKRVRLIKLALHEVEDTFISKMRSDKQIRILKEQINVLISEFEESSIPSTKNIKIREPRNSLSVPKIRYPRTSTHVNDLNSEKELRSNNKIELMAAQKLREQLQAKIHRYELEIQQINEQLQSFKEMNSRLDHQKLILEQKLGSIGDQMSRKEKNYRLFEMEMQQKMDLMRRESIEAYSELEKSNKLLEEKAAYFEERMAEMEIQQLESEEGLVSRCKQHIAYLQRQNEELLNRHQSQIKELKLLYKRKDHQTEEKTEINQAREQSSPEIGRQMRAYCQQVAQLQEENQKLKIWKVQSDQKTSELQKRVQSLTKNFESQAQQLEKKQRQRQAKISELHSNQMLSKEKIIIDLEARFEQQRKLKEQELTLAIKKYDQLAGEMAEMESHVENYIKELKEQYVEVCEKFQLEQALRIQKEKEIERVLQEAEVQREYLSKNYNDHYEIVRSLRQQISANDLKMQKLRSQSEQQKHFSEQLSQELQKQKEQYDSYKQELKNIHQIEISRLEATVVSLTNTNVFLKQLNEKSKEVNEALAQEQEEKQELTKDLKQKQEHILGLNSQICMLKEENQRMGKIVQELTRSINANQQQMEQFAERNSQKLEERQTKYLQLLNSFHEKEKQCYLLNQKAQISRKEHQNREKQLQKAFNQKLHEKSNELASVSSALASKSERLQEIESQLIKLKNSYSLLDQRYYHLDQNCQLQVKDAKERSAREAQRLGAEIARLELYISKLKEENEGLKGTVNLYENDARETSIILIQMRKKNERSIDQYESNIKLMRKKLAQLENDYNCLKQQFQRTNKKLSCLETSKKILEQNYNEDYKLWCMKMKVQDHRSERGLST